MKDWYEEWFESPWYVKLYGHRSDEEAKKAIELVLKETRIKKGAKVLDLCCGYGRHSRALADCGYDVTGIDGSEFLIQKAIEEYGCENTHFIHLDMRAEYPEAPFDLVVNFFTSFGYFDDDKQNELVLRRVFNALKKGGYFFFDFLNADFTKANLVAETVSNLNGSVITQKRRIENDYVIKDIFIDSLGQHPEGLKKYQERVRLYTCEKLSRMLEDAGFIIEKNFGTYSGDEFLKKRSPRFITIARK
ncbi:MAG TPA: class I SAM-dependent methyltransferase [Patescibacteria group bacterium]|nr:class I SAM-dependent methyltransferase [Patescibacteria group bacterium]